MRIIEERKEEESRRWGRKGGREEVSKRRRVEEGEKGWCVLEKDERRNRIRESERKEQRKKQDRLAFLGARRRTKREDQGEY